MEQGSKPVVLLGEAMGEAEVRLGCGFVGPSGVELLRLLDESGLIQLTSVDRDYISRYYTTGDSRQIDMIWRLHPEVHRSNVFQLHPPGNNLAAFCGPRAEGIPGYPPILPSKYIRTEYTPQLERLRDELCTLDPDLIICLGNTALWALCGSTGISKVRGTTRLSTHLATGFKLLPTYHPAAVLRQWELRPTVVADLMKAAREAEYPEIRRPAREIWIEPTLEDLYAFYETWMRNCSLLSVDIETAGTQITNIGFAPSPNVAINIPFHDSRRANGSYWPNLAAESAAWKFVRGVLCDPTIPKLFQNGLYDLAFLWRSVRIPTLGASEDTMLLSHALQPESLKGLGYLGSIYSDEGAWKQDRAKFTKTIKRDA